MKMLDVVALKADRPDLQLAAGERGTIVEEFATGILVEFSDENGREYAMPFLLRDEVEVVWEAPEWDGERRPAAPTRRATG